MKCLVAINRKNGNELDCKYLGQIRFGKEQIDFGEIELEQPYFDVNSDANSNYLLLKVKSFSCNYRDKSLLVENYKRIKEKNRMFIPFGSEICAEVVEIGANVTEFKVGDRVMTNCAYPDSGDEAILPGVATNFASLGWQRIHKKKLVKVPGWLNNAEAAAFSLGVQTASSMIRRSGILDTKGNALVFSARSATSLFIIQQLIAHGIIPICVSTSEWNDEEKKKIFPAILLKTDDMSMFENIEYVFDPFFDMNIGLAVKYINVGGTYITCGLRDQHPLLSEGTPWSAEPTVRGAVAQAIMKNVSILGNCLGTSQDLKNSLEFLERIHLTPIIDCEYKIEQSLEFVERSFFKNQKLGKAILSYEN